MAIKRRVNIRRGRLLCGRCGFIFAEAVLMLPVLFLLLGALLSIAVSLVNGFRDYAEVWIMRSEMRRMMEDISLEIEYADMVEHLYVGRPDYELRLATRRRAAPTAPEKVRYISFENSRGIIYRKELNRMGAQGNIYTVRSKQPLNNNSTFSYNDVYFKCTRLSDDLYELEMTGEAYKAGRSYTLKTVVLKRSPYYDELAEKPKAGGET